MLTLCPNFITTTLKFSFFRLHLDMRDWKPFRQHIFGNFQKRWDVFGKSSEVAVTFSEIPVMTRRKSHAFDSEKVGRYNIQR